MAGLWKELSTRVPVTVPTEKLKERDDAHALLMVGLRTPMDSLDEYRLEVIRLQEEVNRLRKADEEQQAEVVVLRRDGEDLKAKLEEQADAHAKSAKRPRSTRTHSRSWWGTWLLRQSTLIRISWYGFLSASFCSLFGTVS